MFCLPIPTLIYLWEIYIFRGSVCLLCCIHIFGNMQIWEYINRSQTHECGNWDWGRAIPRKGIHKWDFLCSAYSSGAQLASSFSNDYWSYCNMELRNKNKKEKIHFLWSLKLAQCTIEQHRQAGQKSLALTQRATKQPRRILFSISTLWVPIYIGFNSPFLSGQTNSSDNRNGGLLHYSYSKCGTVFVLPENELFLL